MGSLTDLYDYGDHWEHRNLSALTQRLERLKV